MTTAAPQRVSIPDDVRQAVAALAGPDGGYADAINAVLELLGEPAQEGPR